MMGVLRLYLAVVVLAYHYPDMLSSSWNLLAIDCYAAVCVFFIISGFYMSLILNSTYDRPFGIADFYLNRVLRLYPVYIIIFLVFAGFTAAGYIHAFGVLKGNVSGQDFTAAVGMTLGQRLQWLAGQVFLLPQMVQASLGAGPGSSAGLVFGQMYTVGLELMFYALAPFLVKRSLAMTGALFVLALGFHFVPLAGGLAPASYWQYEVFPCILVFFMAGILAHKVYRMILARPAVLRWSGVPIAVLAVYVWIYGSDLHYGFTNSWPVWGLYLLLIGVVPFLFAATKDSALDRFLGDLSYPVYVIHFLVIGLIGAHPYGNILVPVLTLAISVVVVVALERPVDRLRHALSWAHVLRQSFRTHNT